MSSTYPAKSSRRPLQLREQRFQARELGGLKRDGLNAEVRMIEARTSR